MITTLALIGLFGFAAPQAAAAAYLPVWTVIVAGDDTTFVAYDVPPKLTGQVSIDYPESARQDKLEGDVILTMTISADGTVSNVKVKKGIRKDLDAAAVRSAQTWTFTPAQKDGKPVTSAVALPVRFKLDDGASVKTRKDGTSPSVIERVPPTYPREAAEAGIEGTVHVEMIVDAEGKVIDAKVLKSAHPLLDKAALESVRQWSFEPTGEKRTSHVAPVRFKLSDEK